MKTLIKPRPRGFTLIELMVAMAITTIIITVLVAITSVAMDTWNRSRSEVRASHQAKVMVDSIAADLEGLVVRKGGGIQWLHAGVPTTIQGRSSFKSPNAAELEFFTCATDRYNGQIGSTGDKGGDVSTVGYRLSYLDPITGKQGDFDTFGLYRLLVNPSTTYNKNYFSPNFSTMFKSDNSDATIVDQSNFIGENISQFTVVFNMQVVNQKETPAKTYVVPVALSSNSGSKNQITDFSWLGSGFVMLSSSSSFAAGNQTFSLAEVQTGKLNSIQISMTVLSDLAIDQIRNRKFKDESEKTQFILKNSFQYSKVIIVPQP